MAEYPLKLDLPQVGRALSFRSLSDLKEQCSTELDEWQWLKPFPMNDWRAPSGHTTENMLRRRIKDRLEVLRQAVAIGSDDSIVKALQQAFGTDGFPHSKSSDGKLILSIAKSDPAAGVGALHAATQTLRQPDTVVQEGGAIMYWVKKSKSIDFSADSEAVQSAALDMSRAFDITSREFLSSRARQRRETIGYLNRLRKLRRAIYSRIDQGHQSAIGSIRAVEKRYLEQMTLQAPVVYWKSRAERHSAQFKTMSIAASIYAAFAVVGIGVGGFVFLRQEIANIVATDAPSQIILVELSIFLMLATVVFWVGRILSKILLSERHLATDAAERAVMAETYLALQNDGALSEAERPLVLSALFRASTDGIVKDDGAADPSVVALLARALAPGSSR